MDSPLSTYVLAPGVDIAPATGIADAQPGDVVIDRADMRHHSRLANAMVADLLSQFRNPATVPQAVARMARGAALDPFAMLEEAAPLVADLVAAEVLVQPGRTAAPVEVFVPGTLYQGYQINKVIRHTTDTAVAMAVDDQGRVVAMKTAHPEAPAEVKAAFTREVEIARDLSGTLGPAVLAVLDDPAGPVLVTEWVDALTIDRFIALCCPRIDQKQAVLAGVAQAYVSLHAHGVLHGDIRPSNILIDGSGAVCLIDFGLAQPLGGAGPRLSLELPYLEPEAVPPLQRGALPELTEVGEVCALALMLAELVSPAPVRQLPELREDALAQIAQADDRVQTGSPQLDRVLAKAVARKDRRFQTMRDFAAALQAMPVDHAAPAVLLPGDEGPDAAMDQATYLLRASEITADPELLAQADLACRSLDADAPNGLDKASPLYGAVALNLLGARIAYARRDFAAARAKLQTAANLPPDQTRPAELFAGRAGDLACLAQFHVDFAEVDGRVAILSSSIKALMAQQAQSLTAALSACSKGHPMHLGMAHGIAGQILAILRGAKAIDERLPEVVPVGLSLLAGFAKEIGGGLAWPGTVQADQGAPRTADFAPGWCNGAAGFLWLWMAAEDQMPGNGYAALARGSAAYALGHPDDCPNLCCGRAGRALALAAYADWSGDPQWREQASGLLEKTDQTATPGGSLYRGTLGPALARLELSRLGAPSWIN